MSATQEAVQADIPTTDIVEFSHTELALAELETSLATAKPDFTNKDGYEEGKKFIRGLVSLRTSLDKKRKELNAEDQARIEYRNGEATRITGRLVAMETPLKEAKALVDDEKERQKQAAREAEENRVAAIRAKIEQITELAMYSPNTSAEDIESRLVQLNNLVINAAGYDEFLEAAQYERDRVATVLQASYTERKAYEEGQFALKRQQEEQAEQQRKMDEQAETMRKQQEEIDRQRDEIEKQRAAEAKMLEEKLERERLEREAFGKLAADNAAKEKAEQEEADRIEAMKPDKAKLRTFANRIANIKPPEVNTEEGARILRGAENALLKVSTDILAALGE